MRKQEILAASIAVIVEGGLPNWTVEAVAIRAGCAKGLVLYHYQSKRRLLESTAEAIVGQVGRERLGAVAGADDDVLDRLWAVLVKEVRSGAFAARISLAAMGLTAQLPSGLRDQLARSLRIDRGTLENETAIEAMLDGLSLQLLIGTNAEQVRDGYDRLWLGLIAP
ncbi:MAG: TetR/AcrR family transcriptional regulator [Gemmatimonadales bacterium]